MTIGQLDENLRRFYAEVRTKNKEEYSKSALLGLRHGVERFLNSPPFNKGIKISANPMSNQMLDAKIKQLKSSGKENVHHKPPLEQDLAKFKTSEVFNLNYPFLFSDVYGFTSFLNYLQRHIIRF